MIKFKRILVAVLTAVFLVGSGAVPDITTSTSMAAEATNLDELGGVFPAGITLYSDTFPGLHVTYDTRESYVIKEGKNEISLGVSVTDKKLAKNSTAALKTIFGKVLIPAKEGETSFSKSLVIGIQTAQYEDIILRTGNVSLYNLIKSLTSKDSKEAAGAYAGFFGKLSEVVRFMESEESKPADTGSQESVESNDGQASDDRDNEGDKKELCDRTFLFYMCGSDLESKYGIGSQDLLDFLRAEMPEGIKIYVVTGGSKKWHMNDIATYRSYARQALYYLVEEDKLTPEDHTRINLYADYLFSKYSMDIGTDKIRIWEVVSEGDFNRMVERQSYTGHYMNEPELLSQIIDYAAPKDAAGKYDLIFWDHGGGYSGFGSDELFLEYMEAHKDETENLSPGFSLKHLREGLAGSEFIKSGKKFDIIGFDACQMGNYEAVSSLQELTDYYMGSEENDFDTGWDYYSFFTALEENPGLGTEELGKVIVDAFINKFAHDLQSCLSLVDMSEVRDLDDAISNFSEILLEEIEKDDSVYYELLKIVGKKSHFATKTGFFTSNYLDLKRFMTPIASGDHPFSKELKDAANGVLENLNECVPYTRWAETEIQNGGLSIYFPLAAYYTRDIDNNGTITRFQSASEVAEIYEKTGLNEEYKKVIARFALRNVAGNLLADDWLGEKIKDKEALLAAMKNDKYDWDYWKYLYDAAEVNEDDPNDPTMKLFDKLFEDRITKEDIAVTLPDKVDGEYKNSNPATVVINEPETVAVGDSVKVKVSLYDDRTYLGTIGDSSLYSTAVENSDSGVKYSVSPFNSVWYLLNGQICSMYITKTNEDGSYEGYIPICIWSDAKSASKLLMNEGESRTDYLKRAAKEGKVTAMHLNIVSNADWSTLSVSGYNYLDDSNGSIGVDKTDPQYLNNLYYELLGGADNFYTAAETPTLFSLGTVFCDENEGFSVAATYVNTAMQYYISDVYGNDYYLTNENLGKDQGLDSFYSETAKDEHGDDMHYMTYQESLVEAEKIRDKAGKQAESQSDTTTASEQLSVAASKSKALSVTATEEAVPETTEEIADELTGVVEVKASEEIVAEKAAEETVEKPVEVTDAEKTVEDPDAEKSVETTDVEKTVEDLEAKPAEETDAEKAAEDLEAKSAEETDAEKTVEVPETKPVEVTDAEKIVEVPDTKPAETTVEKTENPIPEVLPVEPKSEETTEINVDAPKQEDNTAESVQADQDQG